MRTGSTLSLTLILNVSNPLQSHDHQVHTLPENCHKGRMKAHIEEITGGEELPFVTLHGVPLAPYSMVMAMADSAELYKKIHGKVRGVETSL